MTNEETQKYNELIQSLGDTPNGIEVGQEMITEILKSASKPVQGLMALFGIAKKAWEASPSMQENVEPGELLKTVITAVELLGVDVKSKHVRTALENCAKIDEITDAVLQRDGECDCGQDHE